MSIVRDREAAVDAVVKGNEGFCAGDSRNCLDFAIEQLHEMLIVAGKKLDEHGVGAGGEVAFHNFRYFLKFGNHLVVHFSKNMQNDSGYEQNYWKIYKKGRHNAF